MTNLIDGTAGNDLLIGTAGDDRLVGLAGDDTLDGGAGTNQIDGGDGNDTILIDGTAVNGSVYIPATGIDAGAGTDTIRFAGLSTDYHIAQVVGGWLTVTDLTGGARTIAANVEHLHFDDTGIWLVEPNPAPLVSGPVTGAIVEGAGVLVVDALANASDTDALTVTNLGVLPAGVSFDAARQSFSIDASAAAFGALAAGQMMMLHIDYGVTDGTTTVAAVVEVTVTGVADGIVILGTHRKDKLEGTRADEQLFGLGKADRLVGGGGNDTMTGGDGADRFIFAGRFGTDLITDFDPGLPREVLDLSDVRTAASFADLQANHLSEVDGNAVLTFGAQSITLEGVAMANLTATDFLF